LVSSTVGTVAWITGGVSDPIDRASATDAIWVVEADHGRALITNEIEAPRIRSECDPAELGFQLIEVPWFEQDAMTRAAEEFAGAPLRQVLSDARDGDRSINAELTLERMTLTEPEQADLRQLGADLGDALGKAVDAWVPGTSTDRELAARVAGALEEKGAVAVCLIVGGDERVRRFRHPLSVGAVVDRLLMAVAVARRGGLHAAATRLCVADPADDVVALTESLRPVDDAVRRASRAGGTWAEALAALDGGYRSIGSTGAWREHWQGGPIAYEQREFEIAPGQEASPFAESTIRHGTAVAWNPSLRGGAKIEDTYLVGPRGLELITATPGWPVSFREAELGASSAVGVKA
jgi:Xaa-Pro aminopeptidase